MNSPKNGEDRSRALAIAKNSLISRKSWDHPMMVQEVEDVDAFEDPDDVDREEVGVKDARHTGRGTAGPLVADAKMIGENSPLSTSRLVGNGWLRRW
jgi:hypothetical protein